MTDLTYVDENEFEENEENNEDNDNKTETDDVEDNVVPIKEVEYTYHGSNAKGWCRHCDYGHDTIVCDCRHHHSDHAFAGGCMVKFCSCERYSQHGLVRQP